MIDRCDHRAGGWRRPTAALALVLLTSAACTREEATGAPGPDPDEGPVPMVGSPERVRPEVAPSDEPPPARVQPERMPTEGASEEGAPTEETRRSESAPADAADQERLFERITAEQERDIVDRAFPLLAAKWRFDKVFVCWEQTQERHEKARARVREAVGSTWEAVSALEFLGWGECTDGADGIRIAVRDEGPHVKRLGRFVSGLSGGMVLNFDYERWGSGCRERRDYCDRVIAVHEFGHAIGFAHEQNRPDTPGECSQAKRAQGSDGDTVSLTPWDPESVMNYCNPLYGNDGVLSAFDVVAVRYIYGDLGS